MRRRSVGHVSGHHVEKGQVVGRVEVVLQLRVQCHALDGGLQSHQAGRLGLLPQEEGVEPGPVAGGLTMQDLRAPAGRVLQLG